MKEQIARAREPGRLIEVIADQRTGNGGEPGQKRETVDPVSLALLNKSFKEALILNQELRLEIAGEDNAESQKVDEFRGLMAVLEDVKDDEDDGMTDAKQEKIIEDAFKALDAFKRANWSNQIEQRNAALELLRQIERIVCLQALKDERKRKLSNRIEALKQSVTSCKSALLKLLDDE
jgi:hypothetical protein